MIFAFAKIHNLAINNIICSINIIFVIKPILFAFVIESWFLYISVCLQSCLSRVWMLNSRNKMKKEFINSYNICSIISNTFLFLFTKRWLSGLELTKCLPEKQTTCFCLSMLLWQTTTCTVRNFRTFTLNPNYVFRVKTYVYTQLYIW